MDGNDANLERKHAVPERLRNGTSQSARAPFNGRERDNLYAAIAASTTSRYPIDFDEELPPAKRSSEHNRTPEFGPDAHSAVTLSHPHLKVAARDPRDQPKSPQISRPASPYTQNPPIDFEGLSWPSASRTFFAYD
jgi:GTP cyclohydrolase I